MNRVAKSPNSQPVKSALIAQSILWFLFQEPLPISLIVVLRSSLRRYLQLLKVRRNLEIRIHYCFFEDRF